MTCTATPGMTPKNPNPHTVPLEPISYKVGNTIEAYSEAIEIGEKTIYMEETFFLISTDTNLSQAYTYLELMEKEALQIARFMGNMTIHLKKLKTKKKDSFQAFEIDLTNTLKLRISLAENSLTDLCIPNSTSSNGNGKRFKRGLFNPVGKLLNLLWGQGDPDEIQELVDYFHTHRQELDRMIKTEGLMLHMFQIQNATLQTEWHFISSVNDELIKEESETMSLEMCLLGLSRFQMMSDALDMFVNKAKLQLANGKNKYLTRSAISEEEMAKILQNITLSTNFKPPFEKISNYYNAPLTHVHEENCVIKQTVILPLIDPSDPYTIEKTKPKFPGQLLYIIRDKRRNFRYLTEKDYKNCLRGESNSLICNKRKIKIFVQKRPHCKDVCTPDTNLFVHDIEPAHIMALLPNATSSRVKCGKNQIYEYPLPQRSTFYLPEHCSLESNIFSISRIIKIPIHVLPHKGLMLPTEISYEKALKLIEVQDYIARNVTQQYDYKMANLTYSFNDAFERANKSHQETKEALKDMDARYEALNFWHTYVTTPLIIFIVCAVVVASIIYCKLFRGIRSKTRLILKGFVSSGASNEKESVRLGMRKIEDKYNTIVKCNEKIRELQDKLEIIESDIEKSKKLVFETLKGSVSVMGRHQLEVQKLVNSNSFDLYQVKERIGMPVPQSCPTAPPVPDVEATIPQPRYPQT